MSIIFGRQYNNDIGSPELEASLSKFKYLSSKWGNMLKRYQLLKDLPDYKMGEIFYLNDFGDTYLASTICADGKVGKWPKEIVENSPEWFYELELKNEWDAEGHKEWEIEKAKTLLNQNGYIAMPMDEFHKEWHKAQNSILKSVRHRDFNWDEKEGKLTEIKEPESVEEKAYSREGAQSIFSLLELRECFMNGQLMKNMTFHDYLEKRYPNIKFNM